MPVSPPRSLICIGKLPHSNLKQIKYVWHACTEYVYFIFHAPLMGFRIPLSLFSATPCMHACLVVCVCTSIVSRGQSTEQSTYSVHVVSVSVRSIRVQCINAQPNIPEQGMFILYFVLRTLRIIKHICSFASLATIQKHLNQIQNTEYITQLHRAALVWTDPEKSISLHLIQEKAVYIR